MTFLFQKIYFFLSDSCHFELLKRRRRISWASWKCLKNYQRGYPRQLLRHCSSRQRTRWPTPTTRCTPRPFLLKWVTSCCRCASTTSCGNSRPSKMRQMRDPSTYPVRIKSTTTIIITTITTTSATARSTRNNHLTFEWTAKSQTPVTITRRRTRTRTSSTSRRTTTTMMTETSIVTTSTSCDGSSRKSMPTQGRRRRRRTSFLPTSTSRPSLKVPFSTVSKNWKCKTESPVFQTWPASISWLRPLSSARPRTYRLRILTFTAQTLPKTSRPKGEDTLVHQFRPHPPPSQYKRRWNECCRRRHRQRRQRPPHRQRSRRNVTAASIAARPSPGLQTWPDTSALTPESSRTSATSARGLSQSRPTSRGTCGTFTTRRSLTSVPSASGASDNRPTSIVISASTKMMDPPSLTG